MRALKLWGQPAANTLPVFIPAERVGQTHVLSVETRRVRQQLKPLLQVTRSQSRAILVSSIVQQLLCVRLSCLGSGLPLCFPCWSYQPAAFQTVFTNGWPWTTQSQHHITGAHSAVLHYSGG